jgi:hypothetical protein
VTETSNFALPAHAAEVVKVWEKSVCNEGYFTLEKERDFRHYLASHFIGVLETSNLALPKHSPEVAQVWSKSVCNEVHFTLETK